MVRYDENTSVQIRVPTMTEKSVSRVDFCVDGVGTCVWIAQTKANRCARIVYRMFDFTRQFARAHDLCCVLCSMVYGKRN